MSEQRRAQNHPQPPSIPPSQGGGSDSPSDARGLAAAAANQLPTRHGGLSSLPDKGGRGEGSDKGGRGEGSPPFLPYDKKLTTLARQNRSNPTSAESKIWREILRMRQFAQFKFLRQKPIGGYIVDFYCAELRLVIEIDGESHAETVEYDSERSKFLNSLGLRVVRYTDDEVLHSLEGVYVDLTCQLPDENCISVR